MQSMVERALAFEGIFLAAFLTILRALETARLPRLAIDFIPLARRLVDFFAAFFVDFFVAFFMVRFIVRFVPLRFAIFFFAIGKAPSIWSAEVMCIRL
jgi:hypothetical protein